MKHSFYIFLFIALSAPVIMANNVNGQSLKDVKLTLSLKNTPLKSALSIIEGKSEFKFVYFDDLVSTYTVDASFKDKPLDYILDKVLSKTSIRYSQRNDRIILTEKPAPPVEKQAQKFQKITGVVADQKTGETLPGVSVRIKGTTAGTTTDVTGTYTLQVNNDNAILVFSYIGYKPKEVALSGNTVLNVNLEPDASDLNEVVVVGYGTQRKGDISGAVATVSGNKLAENPSPTFTNLLTGRIAGLTVVQPTGEPGRDNGSLQIRGLGSYGSNSAPLVLVDGIVADISNLSPQDVESVTVLKDASSAAIYGSRASNGVILITTKRGKKGTSQIEYNNSFGTTSATKLPKLITNSVTYMQLYNAANERSGQPDQYTQAQITAYQNGNGSAQFPNFDWMKYNFKNAPLNRHNLIASGGTDVSDYYVSLGYQNQKGITGGYDYDRYNANIDYNTKINKRIKIGTIATLSYQNTVAPVFTNDNLILLAYAQAPTFSPFLPDGSGRRANIDYITTGGVNRTVDEALALGAQTNAVNNANLQGNIDINITKGLDWRTKAGIIYSDQTYKNRSHPTDDPSYAFQPDASGNYVTNGNGNPPFSGLQEQDYHDLEITVNSVFDYQHTFGTKHNFEALAGYEQYSRKESYLNAARYLFPSNDINEINGGPTDGQTNAGYTTESALRSLFGRLTYNYAGKYYLAGNIRYDGTSRVDALYRYGTFGGGSAAWRVSEENFIKDNLTWVTDFKLRGSFGVLGNQAIGNYPYQQILNYTAYPFANSLSTGVYLGSLTTQNLKWERTATTDLGFDLSLFKGLLGAAFSWYYKNTTGILAQQSGLPVSVGLSAPVVNAGAMVNKGIELELTHQNNIGKVSYGLNFIISKNKNMVTQILGGPNPGVFQVGLPYNSYYLYQFDGIFQSQAQINSSPAQPNSGNLRPGDIKIKDVNGDGKITPDDRVSFSPYPSFTYSFGFNVGYSGFNLSSFFQGVQGQKFYANGWGVDPFVQGSAPTTSFLNAWTPTNPSNTVPAIYKSGYSGVSGYNSTYYLFDASYLRLKSLNLSYTFKHQIIKVDWLKNLTVYVSGSNLFTWTKYPGADPERANTGPDGGRFAQYPQIRILSAGLKVIL